MKTFEKEIWTNLVLNKFINKNSAKPTNKTIGRLAMYHAKIFEACKYPRVEGPIHREGESSLTQI